MQLQVTNNKSTFMIFLIIYTEKNKIKFTKFQVFNFFSIADTDNCVSLTSVTPFEGPTTKNEENGQ